VYVPVLAQIFKTVPLTGSQWGIVAGFGLIEIIFNIIFNGKKEHS